MFYLREKIGEAQKRKHSPLAGSTTYTARENFGSNPHTILGQRKKRTFRK